MGLQRGYKKRQIRIADCIVGNNLLQFAAVPSLTVTYYEGKSEGQNFIKIIDAQSDDIVCYTQEMFLNIYDTKGWEGFIA